MSIDAENATVDAATPRRRRADAEQNLGALLDAAKAVFAESGVDAPVRTIAERAGVGIGTLYRHFPARSDLISAVFRRELDACADAADELRRSLPPGDALDAWVLRYTGFVATKQGLASALHSGDPAYEPLREHFSNRLAPAADRLLAAASAAGAIARRPDADEFLGAVASLSHGDPHLLDEGRVPPMVHLLLAGLRVPEERPTQDG